MNLFGLWRLNCSVFVSWTRPSALSRDSRGKYISPAPPFLTLCRAFISRGLRPYRPRRRTLSSLLVRLRRPTLHRPLRGLRQRAFAPLRSPSSHLLLAARFGCRRTVQSVHIRCAAHTALFSPGGNAVSFHIPGIMRNRGKLVIRFLIREHLLELLLPYRVRSELIALPVLPYRIQLNKLLCNSRKGRMGDVQ